MMTIAEIATEAGMKDIFRDGTRWQSSDDLPSVTLEELTRFAEIVRDEALEDAASIAELTHEGSCGTPEEGEDYSGTNSAEAIRALKGKS